MDEAKPEDGEEEGKESEQNKEEEPVEKKVNIFRQGGPIVERAKSLVKLMLSTVVLYRDFSYKTTLTFDTVRWMRNKLKAKNQMFKGKCFLVNFQWDRVLEKFRDRAIEINQEKGINLALAIEEIPKKVR